MFPTIDLGYFAGNSKLRAIAKDKKDDPSVRIAALDYLNPNEVYDHSALESILKNKQDNPEVRKSAMNKLYTKPAPSMYEELFSSYAV